MLTYNKEKYKEYRIYSKKLFNSKFYIILDLQLDLKRQFEFRSKFPFDEVQLYFIRDKYYLANCRALFVENFGYDYYINDRMLTKSERMALNHESGITHEAFNFIKDYALDWVIQDYFLLSDLVFVNKQLEYEDELNECYWYIQEYEAYFNKEHNSFISLVYIFQVFYRQLYKKINRIQEKINIIMSKENDYYTAYFYTQTIKSPYIIGKRKIFCLDMGNVDRDTYNRVRRNFREHVAAYSQYYVCNKDFGLNDTKRLHFHGVILLKNSEVDSFKKNCVEKFGSSNLKQIYSHPEYISRYINKLTKHAMKVNYGYRRENLIFSRKLLPVELKLKYGLILRSRNIFNKKIVKKVLPFGVVFA